VRPHVGAVVVHEDGNVTHIRMTALNNSVAGPATFVEGELQRAPDFEINGQFLASFFQRLRLAMARSCGQSFQLCNF